MHRKRQTLALLESSVQQMGQEEEAELQPSLEHRHHGGPRRSPESMSVGMEKPPQAQKAGPSQRS